MEELLTTRLVSRTCASSSHSVRTITTADTKEETFPRLMTIIESLPFDHKCESVINVSIPIVVFFVSFVFLTSSTSLTKGLSLLYPDNCNEAQQQHRPTSNAGPVHVILTANVPFSGWTRQSQTSAFLTTRLSCNGTTDKQNNEFKQIIPCSWVIFSFDNGIKLSSFCFLTQAKWF